MRVTIDDIRKAGICVAGARRWFEHRGWDFHDFLKNGMDADTFVQNGDDYCRHVVDRKIEREKTSG